MVCDWLVLMKYACLAIVLKFLGVDSFGQQMKIIQDWTRIVFLKVWETPVLLSVVELFEMSEVRGDITESETEHI